MEGRKQKVILFDPSLVIENYGKTEIETFFRDDALVLYQDLENNKQQIILVDAPKPRHLGHKIRMETCGNPTWYKELYSLASRRRGYGGEKIKTYFSKKRFKKALQNIHSSSDKHRVYEYISRELIFWRLTTGFCNGEANCININNCLHYQECQYRFFGAKTNQVRSYFGLTLLHQLKKVNV